MVWARSGSGVEAFEDRMWDEARAAAERRWRFARATGRHVSLPSAHEEPTLPPGMFRLPPHMRDRTPTPRVAPLQRRSIEPHDDPTELEPTQKRRAPVRRPAPGLAPRTRPVAKPVMRSSPPPVPAIARAWPARPAAQPAWLRPPPVPQPMDDLAPEWLQPVVEARPVPAFALPAVEPAPVVVQPARASWSLHVLVVALACAMAWGYQDLRGMFTRSLVVTEKLGDRLTDVALSDAETRARLERGLAALRAAVAERPGTQATVAVVPIERRVRRRVRGPHRSAITRAGEETARAQGTGREVARRRLRAPVPLDDDDPLAGVSGPARKRGAALEL